MFIHLPCMTCSQETGKPDFTFYRALYNDAMVFEFECRKGHKCAVTSQEAKFTVLFEIGTQAILDGYHRDAVASFHASYESFQKFVIKMFLEEATFDASLGEALLKRTKLSERTKGAFELAHLSLFGQMAGKLPDNKINLRNLVVHEGEIPTEEVAVSFGQAIVEAVHPSLCLAKEKHAETIRKLVWRQLRERRLVADAGAKISTIGGGSLLSLSTAVNKMPKLKEHLNRHQKMRAGIPNVLDRTGLSR